MRNNYDILDEQGFDVESLHPGELALEIQPKFIERDNKGEPVVELVGKIFWVADAENEQYIGKELKWVQFFGKKNDQSPRILKDICKRGGFETSTWNPDNFPLSKALPGTLKLFALRRVPILFKVTASKRDESVRNFLNPVKILRAHPANGEEFADALPAVITNDMVEEALNTKLEGESVDSMV